jgi:hypothetical protein
MQELEDLFKITNVFLWVEQGKRSNVRRLAEQLCPMKHLIATLSPVADQDRAQRFALSMPLSSTGRSPA